MKLFFSHLRVEVKINIDISIIAYNQYIKVDIVYSVNRESETIKRAEFI